MDIVCTNCGEPWDVMHVLHEEPQSFTRNGSLIRKCPSCEENLRYREQNCTEKEIAKEKERLSMIEEVCEMLGDDIDGAASYLEDFKLL